VIFDAELSPGQQKALENAFNKEVIQNDFLGSEKAVSTDHYVFVCSWCLMDWTGLNWID
jgi:hypothetical protein